MNKYVLALDQGTTSSRAIVFDHSGRPVASAQKEFTQIYPKPGWVEHDPEEIWSTQAGVATEVLAKAGLKSSDVAGIGITNQRETTVVWNRLTGKPVYNAKPLTPLSPASAAELKGEPIPENPEEPEMYYPEGMEPPAKPASAASAG